LAFAALAAVSLAATPQVYSFGVDVSALVSVTQWKCLAKSNPVVTHAIVRAFRSTGSSDPSAVQSLKNAQAAGYDKSNLGVYIFPRPLSSAGVIQDGGAQIKAMMNNLINNGAGDLFTSIWIDVEGGDLYWSRTVANNVKFIEQMLTAAKTYQPKYQLGIYTSASQWSPIVGSYTGGKDYPLWYASYNNQLNFNDFKAFAGWTVPTLHQYAGDKTVCGVGLDQNLALWGTLSAVTGRAPINGGAAPVAPPLANSVACQNVHGACQDIAAKPCVGTVKSGLCPGPKNVVCCVGAPVLKSSAPSAPVSKSTAPGAAKRVPKKKLSTHGRVTAIAQDTGKVTWHRDRPRRHSYRKMKMGALMRIKKHRKHRKHKKRKMVRASNA